jgi:hypothetical protein
MAKRIRNAKGAVVALEFTATEMAEKVLGVEVDDLLSWERCLPPTKGQGPDAVFRINSPQRLDLLKRRAAVLKTSMSEEAVTAVEKAGLLEAYADLAEDCPEGLTAHVWRSYGLIVLMQTRYGRMIDAAELAERGGLVNRAGKPDTEMAAKHIRLLQALDYLEAREGRWEHKGLPRSWTGGEDEYYYS